MAPQQSSSDFEVVDPDFEVVDPPPLTMNQRRGSFSGAPIPPASAPVSRLPAVSSASRYTGAEGAFTPGVGVGPKAIEQISSGAKTLSPGPAPALLSQRYMPGAARNLTIPPEKAKAVSNIIEGATTLAQPALLAGAATAPIATPIGFAAGAGSSALAGRLAHGKVSPESEELIRQLAFWVPGIAGELVQPEVAAEFSPEGTRVGATVAGGRAGAGVQVTPNDITVAGKVGPFSRSKTFTRGVAPAGPGIEPPTIEGQPPASPAPRPDPAATIIAEHDIVMQRAERMAQGKPPLTPEETPPPPPPISANPNAPASVKAGNLSLEDVGQAAQAIAKLPPAVRAQAMQEAHATLTKVLMEQAASGKPVVLPSGELTIIKDPATAEKVALQVMNEAIRNHDKAQAEAAKTDEPAKETRPAQPTITGVRPNSRAKAEQLARSQFEVVEPKESGFEIVEPDEKVESENEGRPASESPEVEERLAGSNGGQEISSPDTVHVSHAASSLPAGGISETNKEARSGGNGAVTSQPGQEKAPFQKGDPVTFSRGLQVRKGEGKSEIIPVGTKAFIEKANTAGATFARVRLTDGRVQSVPLKNLEAGHGGRGAAPSVASEAPKYKFGSTQANIPSNSEASKALGAARARISDSDLAGKGKEIGEGGNHVTVRYGIKGDDTAAIKKYLSEQKPFEASLGKTEKFPPSEHSDNAAVIVAPIEAQDLHRINSEIEKHGEFTEPSFKYKPHATVAYVDPEKADRYVGMDVTHGKKFTVNQIAITDKNGDQDVVKLEGKNAESEPAAKTVAGIAPLAPGKVGEMNVADLKVAPHKFQYKLSTDAEGVGTLLKETKVFNPDLAGVISVWRDPADGKFYVVNGHHRYELAKRTGQPTVTVRHIVAKDAAEARAMGALQNIAEGRGSAIDAAKFFHDTGTTPESLKEKGISLGEKTAKDGLAMSRLDPAMFAKVVSGDLRQGRAIGEATAEPVEQKAILSLVERKERSGAKVSDDTLSELIRLVKGSEQTTETTANLFGTQEINRSLALEKPEISAYIKQQLAKDKKLFGFVAKEGRATELARAGNKIDVEKSKEISTGAAQAEEVYNKLSERGGPIASILDEAARKLADGEQSGTVKDDAYQHVRAEISKTLGGTTGPGAGRPEGTPETSQAAKPTGSIERIPATQLAVGDTFVDTDGHPRRVTAIEGEKIRTADGTLKTYTGEIELLGDLNSARARLAQGGMFHDIGLSDEELEQWSKAKGFRVEPAGEQLGMFEANEPLLRVFRSGPGGREQRGLVYQSQIEKLNAPIPASDQPFTLTGGESREEQPRLFGAGDMGEIIGTGKNGAIKLPTKEREPETNLFSPEKGSSEDFVKRFESDRGGYISRYLKKNTEHGIVYISADRARSLFPEYAASKKAAFENTVATNRAASLIASAAFDKAIASGELKNKEAAFVAGMPGAGKSTAENAFKADAAKLRLVYEGNLSDPALLQRRVQSVQDAGGHATVVYVYAPPKVALDRMIARAREIGRYVPIEYGARVAANTPPSIEKLYEKYGDGVSYAAVDNSGKLEDAKYTTGIDAVRTLAHNLGSHEHTDQHASARGSERSEARLDQRRGKAEAPGGTGPGDGGQHQAEAAGSLTSSSDEIRAEQLAHADSLLKSGKLDPALYSKITGQVSGQPGARDQGEREAEAPGSLTSKSSSLLKDESGTFEPGKTLEAVSAAAGHVGDFLRQEIADNRRARELQWEMYDLDKRHEGRVLHAKQLLEGLQKDGVTQEDRRAIDEHLDALQANSDEIPIPELTPAQDKILDEVLSPMREEAEVAYKKVNAGGMTIPNYNPRQVKGRGGMLDRFLTPEAEKRTGRGNLLSQTNPATKHRSMMALEAADGAAERKVVSIKGNEVTAMEGGKEGGKMGNLSSGLNTNLEILNEKLNPLVDRVFELRKQIAAVPEQDKKARIEAIHEKIEALQKERNAAKQAAGRDIGKTVGERAVFGTRESREFADKIAALEQERADIHSSGHMSNAGEARVRHLKMNLSEVEAERDRVLAQVPTDELLDKIWIDKNGKRWKIGQATKSEIEAASEVRYYHDALASTIVSWLQAKKAEAAFDFMENLKSDPDFSQIATKSDNPPKGWRTTNLPQMKGYYLEPHTAEVFDWFNDRLKSGSPNAFDSINQYMRAAILLDPIPHPLNVGAQWAIEKGASGFLPQRWMKIGRTGAKAINAVLNQNEDFLDSLDAGAPLQSAHGVTRNLVKLFYDQMAEGAAQGQPWATKLAKAVGLSPLTFVNALHSLSSKVAWGTSDVLFLQAAYEYQADHPGASLHDALREVGRIIPEYRLPTRILDSPTLAKAMSSSVATMFGSYHYGLLRSFTESAKSAMGAGEPAEGRTRAKEIAKGWDRLAMLALGAFVLPPLAREILKKITGNKDADLRLPGMFGLVQAVARVSRGEETPTQALTKVMTPNPVSLGLAQGFWNRDFRTGRHLYDPAADWATRGTQLMRYLKEQIPQVPQIERATEHDEGGKQYLWGLANVNFPKHGADALAQQIASSKMDTSAWTPEDRERYYARQRALDSLRRGDSKALEEGLEKGQIRSDELTGILRRSQGSPLYDKVHGFSYEETLKVFDRAVKDGDEQAQEELLPLLMEKQNKLLEQGRFDEAGVGAQ